MLLLFGVFFRAYGLLSPVRLNCQLCSFMPLIVNKEERENVFIGLLALLMLAAVRRMHLVSEGDYIFILINRQIHNNILRLDGPAPVLETEEFIRAVTFLPVLQRQHNTGRRRDNYVHFKKESK